MRTLVAVAVALLLAAGLAGCADDPERYPDAKPETTSRSATSSSSTSRAPVPNRAPTANLTAGPVNGTAPLNVTFSLSGSDADGDALSWTLAFGDGNQTNGTALPGNVTHAYAAGGNFTATLTVSDGNRTANATATVRVAAGSVGFAPGMDPACQRPDVAESPSGHYADDRGGGSIWIYEESNDIPGLQLTDQPTIIPAPVGGYTDPLGEGCLGGDTLIY